MRRASRYVAGAAAAFLAGCTLLIPFDEVSDGGTRAEAGTPPPEPPPEPPSGDDAGDAPSDAPRDTARDVNLDALKSCNGLGDGFYCGDHGPTGYPYPDDLLHCMTNKVASATICAPRCLRFPVGQPDECDDCYAHEDGTFCGKDMKQWASGAANANYLVRCIDGGTDTFIACGAAGTAGPTCASD
ncbi:MAG TPA: hypothetical protein VIF62_26025, partial [Labilithrix sp.]